MKPSELLKIELELRSLGDNFAYERALADFLNATDRALDSLSSVLGGGVRNNYEQTTNQARESVRRIHGPIIDLADYIKQLRNPMEEELKSKTYNQYLIQSRNNLTYKFIKKTLPVPSDSDMENFLAIIRSYSNWKFPGCIIRPVNSKIMDQVVDSDPIYVLEYNDVLLGHYLEYLPEKYQNRVRKLILKNEDFEDFPKLPGLPYGQLGLIVAYNFFNFTPFTVLSSYLKEIYVKLKQGGSCIFTYNNCSFPHGLALCEAGQSSYTTHEDLVKLVAHIGYQIEHDYSNHYDFHYLHIKRPGELSSIRGGQALIKISDLKSYDLTEPSILSKEHKHMLEFSNLLFNIDTYKNIKFYSLEAINEWQRKVAKLTNTVYEYENFNNLYSAHIASLKQEHILRLKGKK